MDWFLAFLVLFAVLVASLLHWLSHNPPLYQSDEEEG